MRNPFGMNRRKFMEIGIYTISGTMAAVSGAALARFALGPSFDRNGLKSNWRRGKVTVAASKELS